MSQRVYKDVHYETNGLRSLREVRDRTAQTQPHSHNEIEVLLLEKGAGTWLMGGDEVRLAAGQLVAFWAVRPHQIIESASGTVLHWLTIPLSVFTGWKVPQNLSKMLLGGSLVMEPDRNRFTFDLQSFQSWHKDLVSEDPQLQKLALLEIEARIGRLACSVENKKMGKSLAQGVLNHSYFEKSAQIAEYVSRHYTEPLRVEDVAQGVGMHPATAAKIFKKVCGINLMQFLTQHRILHAQRLLVTTDMKILDIAFDSGYRSVSRFYAAFAGVCDMSPSDFRARLEAGKAPPKKKAGVWKITGKKKKAAA